MTTDKALTERIVESAVVTLDTNIMFSPDPKSIVSQEFEEFLNESTEKSQLLIQVPELVVKEIIQHKVRLCRNAVDGIGNKLRCIFDCSDKRYKCPASVAQLERAVDKKVRKWFIKNRIDVIPTPHDKISTEEIERYALRNLPPFQDYSDKSQKGDKGIKDYLILKTVLKIKDGASGRRFVFLCNDSRLIVAFERELGKDENVESFKNLNEYQNLIALKYEKYSDKFVKSVVKAAAKKFYDFEKKTGLLVDSYVLNKIKKDFSSEMSTPGSVPLDLIALVTRPFEPINDGKFTLSPPKYTGKVDKLFQFLSQLHFTKRFVRQTEQPLGLPQRDERELQIVFDVHWNANISKDGRFKKKILGPINISSKSSSRISPPIIPPLKSFLGPLPLQPPFTYSPPSEEE